MRPDFSCRREEIRTLSVEALQLDVGAARTSISISRQVITQRSCIWCQRMQDEMSRGDTPRRSQVSRLARRMKSNWSQSKYRCGVQWEDELRNGFVESRELLEHHRQNTLANELPICIALAALQWLWVTTVRPQGGLCLTRLRLCSRWSLRSLHAISYHAEVKGSPVSSITLWWEREPLYFSSVNSSFPQLVSETYPTKRLCVYITITCCTLLLATGYFRWTHSTIILWSELPMI